MTDTSITATPNAAQLTLTEADKALDDSIPNLRIEWIDDGTVGGQIILEQDNSGNVDCVGIHPIQLRYMAEKIGLVPSGDLQAQKAITTLQRRLRMLDERIAHLADFLAEHSDHKHADLRYETTYARATADLSGEFCREMDEGGSRD